MRVYGPYLSSTGKRRIVILVHDDGTRTTMSNARWVLSQHLGRALGPDEEADHIDGDTLNDDISNLQVLSPLENVRKSAKPVEMVEFSCPMCGERASRPARRVRHNQGAQGKRGPFCSRRCARLDQLR